MSDEKNHDAGTPRGIGEGISTDEVVAGRRTLPPGYGDHSRDKVFTNRYIEMLAQYPDLIRQGEAAEACRGRWLAGANAQEGTDYRALELEIGSGNGFYLQGMCQRFPHRLFVGVEVRYKRVWLAAKKLHESGLSNGRVVLHHAGYMARLFAPGELSAIHINHPDPWPKERHAGNRLFNAGFAELCDSLLVPGGLIQIKSDFAPHALAARQHFVAVGFQETAFTADLHQPGEALAEGNIITNYERKFMRSGEPVFLQRLVKPGDGPTLQG